MAVKLFASILIGSTETEMKLFQLSPRKGMLQLSCQSRRIDLGSDAYARGTLSTQKVELLVRTLKAFKKTMDGYHVDSYRMVATSAIRELRTALITKDYIDGTDHEGLHREADWAETDDFIQFRAAVSRLQVHRAGHGLL